MNRKRIAALGCDLQETGSAQAGSVFQRQAILEHFAFEIGISKAAPPSFRLKSVVFRLIRRGRPLSRPPERLPFSTANRSKK